MVACVCVDDNANTRGKVRAPPERMPDNNWAIDDNCIAIYIIHLLTESATEKNRLVLRLSKGEKVG